jgi:hopanoid-associated phosphorylase
MGRGYWRFESEREKSLMKIGIVAAMADEAGILVGKSIQAGELSYLPEGGMIFLSGIGAKRARSAALALIEKGATSLVSWGVAGGLSAEVSAGTLILPERVIAVDRSIYYVDPVWHKRLCSRLETHIEIHRGPLAESVSVVADCTGKIVLSQQAGAIAVDMESASIALAAKEASVPFMVIRAITDGVEMAIPRCTINSKDKFGRIRLLRLLLSLIRRPAEAATFFRLGRNFQAARATLTTVVRKAGSNMLCPERIDSPFSNKINRHYGFK